MAEGGRKARAGARRSSGDAGEAAAPPEEALARAPAALHRRRRGRSCSAIAGVVDRLRVAEAARRTSTTRTPSSSRRSRKSRSARPSPGRSTATTGRAPATCRPRGSGRRSGTSGATPTGRCSSSRRSSPAAGSSSSTTAATRSRSTPTPASSSGSGGSAASTPPRRPTTSKRLYIVNLVPGHIVKLDAKTGRTIWKRSLPGRAESSPLVIGRTVYFGCEDGNLYALSTRNGNVRWSTPLGGAVKSAPAYYGGVLYVGDYGGYMNAVNAKTGKLKWQSGSLGPGFGGTGEFYSTPAVAFGRVYAGNNDSRVYSFDISDGELAWSYSTGGYVYSGPAVAQHPAHRPDRLHRLLRRQRLRAQREERRTALDPVGGRPGDRLADRDRQHRLRGRVRRHLDHRLRDEDRPPGLPLPARHLHAGGLRRPPPLPDRLLEHQRPAAVQVQRRGSRTRSRPRRGSGRLRSAGEPATPGATPPGGRGGGVGWPGAKAGKRFEWIMPVEHAEAGRVVLDPVGAGGAEVLVVDEHLAALVALDPGHQVFDVARVVAAGDAPLGQREGLRVSSACTGR